MGYWRLHPSKPIHDMRNLRDLAEDAALQLQAEGGTMLCQKQLTQGALSQAELHRMREALKLWGARLDGWLEQGAIRIDAQALDAYFSLWKKDKIVYWLGEMMCLPLLGSGTVQSVAHCMRISPLDMMAAARKTLGC